MTDGVEIRLLGPGDAGLVAAMSTMFGRAFDDPTTYTTAPPEAAYLERLLGGDTFIAIAALDHGAVVGGLVAYELPKYEQARSEIYIYDLAVAEGCRRRGIATAMIAEIRRIAAVRGAWVVYVQADYVDAPAVALYTKLGVREDVMHFDIAPME